MTVSNVVSPLMVYLDRFIIGVMVSMTAVTFYVTPYEVVTRLWVIPGALLSVLFPAFAGSFGSDRARTAELIDQGTRATMVVVFPLALVLVAFAPEGLALWVGDEFARNSAPVLQLLALGVFLNSVGQVPYSAIQAVGRPDLTGKLHLLELPIYLVALWWLIGSYGIVGAAAAWVLRVTIDTVALFYFSAVLVRESRTSTMRAALPMLVAVCMIGVTALPTELPTKMAMVACVLALFTFGVWWLVLEPGERSVLQSRARIRAADR